MKGYYKIRELAESAAYTTVSSEGRLFSQRDMIAFAELVVSECIKEINSVKLETFANDSHIRQMTHNKIQLVEHIKQHFGVKE